MNNAVPEKLINFRCYNEGADLLGITDIELPSISYMTETVKGAGIAGEIDSPTIGHFKGLETKFNWRTVEKPLVQLAGTKTQHFDLRGAQQTYDQASKSLKVVPVKVVVEGMVKTTELGKFDVGATTNSSTTMETTYLKVSVNGETILEIDKYNYVAKIGDTDYMAEVRSALGLG